MSNFSLLESFIGYPVIEYDYFPDKSCVGINWKYSKSMNELPYFSADDRNELKVIWVRSSDNAEIALCERSVIAGKWPAETKSTGDG